MLSEYVQAAMRRATFEQLADGTTYGEIPGFQGVWANAETPEECRRELREVLEEWIVLRLSDRLDLPVVDGLELTIRDVA